MIRGDKVTDTDMFKRIAIEVADKNGFNLNGDGFTFDPYAGIRKINWTRAVNEILTLNVLGVSEDVPITVYIDLLDVTFGKIRGLDKEVNQDTRRWIDMTKN